MMADARLVQHHWCEPLPGHEHRETFGRSAWSSVSGARQGSVMQRKAALERPEHKDTIHAICIQLSRRSRTILKGGLFLDRLAMRPSQRRYRSTSTRRANAGEG